MLYSVVIPYYNSTVIELLCVELSSYFTSINVDYEIIIVNDFSNDSRKILLNSCEQNDARVKVIHFEQNYGQDYSTGFGISKASGNYIITIDDDLEFPVKEIEKLIAANTTADIDVIYGMPSKAKNSLFRKYTRVFYYLLIKSIGYNSFGSFRLINARLKKTVEQHYADKNFCIDKLLLKEAKKIMHIDIINHPKEKSRYNKLKLFKKFLLFFIYRY